MNRSRTSHILLWSALLSVLLSCERAPQKEATRRDTPPARRAVSLPPLETRSPSVPKPRSSQVDAADTLSISDGAQVEPIVHASTFTCHEGTLLQLHTRRGKKQLPHTTSFLFPFTQLPARSSTSTTLEEISRTSREVTFSFAPEHVLLSTTQPPLEIDLLDTTYDALPYAASVDHGLGAAGCFHTGRFTLMTQGAGEQGHTLLDAHSAFAFYSPTREVYTLVHEIDARTAISILLYLPAHLMDSKLPIDVDLAEVFSDPEASSVRAFIKTRTHEPTPPHRITWLERPIEQGRLRISIPEHVEALPLQATSLSGLHLELIGLEPSRYPELSHITGTSTDPLTLDARHAIIPDGDGKRIPPVPK